MSPNFMTLLFYCCVGECMIDFNFFTSNIAPWCFAHDIFASASVWPLHLSLCRSVAVVISFTSSINPRLNSDSGIDIKECFYIR